MGGEILRKVLLALGDMKFTTIVRTVFSENAEDFIITDIECFAFEYLEEMINEEQPQIIVIDEKRMRSQNENPDDDWLNLLHNVKIKFDDMIRFVFITDRELRDPFVSKIISLGVYDIFSGNSFHRDNFIQQLKEPPRYSRISKFADMDSTFEYVLPEKENAQEAATSEPEVIEEVIEKKVEPPVKEVVTKRQEVRQNKNEIKRDFKVTITQQVTQLVGIPIEKQIWVVGGAFSRMGSSFVSHILAKEVEKLGIQVTYVESPFSFGKSFVRFYGEKNTDEYVSPFYHYVVKEENQDNYHKQPWIHSGVNMVVRNPMKEPIYSENQLPLEAFLKLFISSQASITIVDLGSDMGIPISRDILDIANQVFILIEPDIPNIQALEESLNGDFPYYRSLLNQEKVHFIANRMDVEVVKHNYIQKLYGPKLLTTIPNLSSSSVFRSQDEGKFLQEYRELNDSIEKIMRPVMKNFLPKELFKQRLGSKWFKPRIEFIKKS